MGSSGTNPFAELVEQVTQRVSWERELHVDGYTPHTAPLEPLTTQQTAPTPQEPAPQRAAPKEPAAAPATTPVLAAFVGAHFNGEHGALLQRITGAMKLGDGIALVPMDGNWITQLEGMRPRVIVTLGATSTTTLEPGDHPRGNLFSWRGIPVMPTLSLGAVLQDPALKRPVWEDMKQVMALLQRTGK